MVLRNRSQSQENSTPDLTPAPEQDRRRGLRRSLRGMSYAEGASELSPIARGNTGNPSQRRKPAAPLLSADQAKQAIPFNLKGHTISMLVRIRDFLVRTGWLTGAAQDKGDRVDQWPSLVVDAAFVQAVAAYQSFKGNARPDGRINSQTFALFEAQGLQYSLQGGGEKANRDIIPKDAPDEQVYDYFRRVILDQGGIFLDKPGYVNMVAIRGGQLAGDGIRHVNNTFNRWNDTIVVLSVNAAGKRMVQRYEATTDPGVAKQGVATLTEGTHTMELGYHAPSSGTYTALNPSHNGQVPVFRRGGGRHLGTDARGGQWLNVHTTHGYNKGALPGPGGYSEGCAVVNGQDQYARFIGSMKSAKKQGQSNFFFTVISAGRLGTMKLKSQQNSTR